MAFPALLPLLSKAAPWLSAAMMAAFFPSMYKAGKKGVSNIGEGYKEMFGGKPGMEEAIGEEQREQARFLGMLEDKAKREKAPEIDPTTLQLMTLMNVMAPAERVMGEGIGEELDATPGMIARILAEYGAGDVTPERVRGAVSRVPGDARLGPLAGLRRGV